MYPSELSLAKQACFMIFVHKNIVCARVVVWRFKNINQL